MNKRRGEVKLARRRGRELVLKSLIELELWLQGFKMRSGNAFPSTSSDWAGTSMKVVIVFDPSYDERDDADLGRAFWLVESPCNRALALRSWGTGTTDANSVVFAPTPHRTPEDEALDRFWDADLHHPDWNEMAFVGVALSPGLRRKLVEQGVEVEPTQAGFTLRR